MTALRMSRAGWWACAMLVLSAWAAHAAQPSACADVAAQARTLPDAAWSGPDPLAPWLRRQATRASQLSLSPAEQDQVDYSRWRELLGAGPEQALNVERLQGTHVMRVEQFAGTANCQTYVLLDATPGQPARVLQTPLPVDQPMGLCATQSAFFATVMGRPALAVGGGDSMLGLDRQYRLSLWDGKGWTPPCALALKLRPRLRQTERRCQGDGPWCDAAALLARDLALAYDAERRGGDSLAPQDFTDGHQPDRYLRASLQLPDTTPGAAGDPALQLPSFGRTGRERNPLLSSYANVDTRRLAIRLDGRWWLAVVGRAGVGWRESIHTLVTLYEPLGRAVDARAGFRFTLEAAGLAEAKAGD